VYGTYPGGPNNNIPDRRLPLKSSGYFNGNSTASIISFRIDSNPPISSHRTSGNDDDESGNVLDDEPPVPDDCVNDHILSRFGSKDCRISTGDDGASSGCFVSK
jgi:hypothetical protein